MEIDCENLFCIEDMKEEDLDQVLNIRNHPNVICRLHTPVEFTLEQSKRWFNKENPIWFCIKEISTGKVVGYFRTSNLDYETKDLYIGCDIHPDFQRRGVATWGYKKVFKTLADIGWKSLSLEVLKNNIIARSLYINLGFEDSGEDDSSFFMKKNIGCGQVEKNVKVLSCYLGYRRRGFFRPAHMLKMLEFLWKQEEKIDNGVLTDTVLVYNKLSEEDKEKIEDIDNYNKCEKFLYSLNCKKTKNGHCFVVERENIGISYGAFDFAFNLFKDDYKYWLFLEDDHIVVKDNMMKKSIQQLMRLSLNNPCGFVASVAVTGGTEESPIYAHGGCGCTSKNILNKVVNNNYSETLNRGFLPHLIDRSSRPIHILSDYDKMPWWEKKFTNSIFELG